MVKFPLLGSMTSRSDADAERAKKEEDKPKTKEQLAREAKQEAKRLAKEERKKERDEMRRKRRMKKELPPPTQVWNFVVGHAVPRKKRNWLHIPNVTIRNLWMEHEFLYSHIQALLPDTDVLFAPEYYWLYYQLPGNPYRHNISLTEREQQQRAFETFEKLPMHARKRLLLHLVPRDADARMFQVIEEQEVRETWESKAQVMRALAHNYMNGNVSIQQLTTIAPLNLVMMKKELFRTLPPTMQHAHKYLADVEKHIKPKPADQQYLDGDITLDEYTDLKFPARKARREEENASYPKPEKLRPCIVCGEVRATIKCMQCHNRICKMCIIREFHGENVDSDDNTGAQGATNLRQPSSRSVGPAVATTATANAEAVDAEFASLSQREVSQSFVLMHRRHCMRFGHQPPIRIAQQLEPAFFRHLGEEPEPEAEEDDEKHGEGSTDGDDGDSGEEEEKESEQGTTDGKAGAESDDDAEAGDVDPDAPVPAAVDEGGDFFS